MSAHHVELRNVTKRFGAQKAVNQVDLVLKAGESVGLAGHNGAGKSTLIKLILGLITPTEGEVMLLGERTGSKAGAQLRSQIGYLPETVALLSDQPKIDENLVRNKTVCGLRFAL